MSSGQNYHSLDHVWADIILAPDAEKPCKTMGKTKAADNRVAVNPAACKQAQVGQGIGETMEHANP